MEMNNSTYMLGHGERAKLMSQAEAWYGPLNQDYLTKSLGVTYRALGKYSRVWAVRVDLRFAQDFDPEDLDIPLCFQRNDHKAITRFMESLKSQLKEDLLRKGRMAPLPLFEYIWVRERDAGLNFHYHLMLFFNKDLYAFLGSYSEPESMNMATRIQKAWCSALGLSFPESSSLVHFPENGTYHINKKSATAHDGKYLEFLMRLAYLAKDTTKDSSDGFRNIGCSQG